MVTHQVQKGYSECGADKEGMIQVTCGRSHGGDVCIRNRGRGQEIKGQIDFPESNRPPSTHSPVEPSGPNPLLAANESKTPTEKWPDRSKGQWRKRGGKTRTIATLIKQEGYA